MPDRVQGPACYFPSIEKKYGQPIGYRLGIIGTCPLAGHKALVDWLKAGHGVGHGHATALAGYALAQRSVHDAEHKPQRSISGKWNPPYYDDELSQAVLPRLADAGAHLHGRRSCELFRSVFTGPAAPPHAGLMTNTPKIVVSATLKDPGWGPTTVISSDIAAALTDLKQQPGKDITVGASGTLVRCLLTEGLLAELSLLVHPVLAGTGRHLFEAGAQQVPLTLLESRPHRNGVVALRYAPAR